MSNALYQFDPNSDSRQQRSGTIITVNTQSSANLIS